MAACVGETRSEGAPADEVFHNEASCRMKPLSRTRFVEAHTMAHRPPPPPPVVGAGPRVDSGRVLARRGERPMSESVLRAQSSMAWRGGTGAAQCVALQVGDVALSVAQEPGREVHDRGTGGTVWNCAFVMTKYLEKLAAKEGDAWRSLRVLELGSGTGVVGIAAALLFRPAHLRMTDLPAQLPLMEQNLQAARGAVTTAEARAALERVLVAPLDWAAPNEAAGSFDVLLASDCIWPKVDNALFVNVLSALATPRTRVLLAYEYRSETCRQTFFAPAQQHFTFTRVPNEELHPDFRADDIELYSLTRKETSLVV